MLEIGLSGVNDTGARLQVVALVDSGADATMLPLRNLQQVNASYLRQQVVRGIAGQGMFANLYLVQVHIGANVVRLMEVLAAPKGVEAILGRDLLNQFVITLHGPVSTIEVDF
jgi:predicted aspartyl protease